MATREQYRPQPPHDRSHATSSSTFADDYARNGYAYGAGQSPYTPQEQKNTQMTAYQPPTAEGQVRTTNTALAPHQRQAYHQNQEYQQNSEAFDKMYGSDSESDSRKRSEQGSRRNSPKRTERPSEQQAPSVPSAKKAQIIGGPLAGAAGGAMIGSSLGGMKKHAALGTIGGMVAGGFAGHQVETKVRQKQQDKRELTQHFEDKAERREQHAQDVQDRYDNEYTKVAQAAPGYGSSLLPGDTSHGGPLDRNNRSS